MSNQPRISGKRKSIADYFQNPPAKVARSNDSDEEEEEETNVVCGSCDEPDTAAQSTVPTPEFIASLGTAKRRGCVGNNKKLCPFSPSNPCGHCLHRTVASNARAMSMWDFNKNGLGREFTTTLGTHHNCNWKCPKCFHEWQATGGRINSSSNPTGCPACSNSFAKGCCIAEDCMFCPTNNIRTNSRAWSMWDNSEGKNIGLDPRLIPLQSKTIIDWKCATCNHRWKSKSADVNGPHQNNCPACVNRLQDKGCCISPDCKFCPTNNIRNNEYAWSIWDKSEEKNIGRDPRTTPLGTNVPCDWKCPTCNHEWITTWLNVKKNHLCPACANTTKECCTAKDCTLCYTKCVESNNRAIALWDYEENAKEGLNPRLITHSSGKIVHWKCLNKSCLSPKWRACVFNVVRGHSCPSCCQSVAEKEVLEFLISCNGKGNTAQVTPQFTDITCKDKNKLPFDFLITEQEEEHGTKWIFEADGMQHFIWELCKRNCSREGAKAVFKLNRKHDIYKMIWAVSNGYCLVRYLSSIIRQSVQDPSKWQDWLRRVHAKHIVPCFENKTTPVIVFPDSREYRGMYDACVESDKRFEEWVVWEPLL